jgi:coenzyme F420-dependent glucose-6-phosphate dehydrogenase
MPRKITCLRLTTRFRLKRFEAAGGNGKPSYGQLTVCRARDDASARRITDTYWPTAAFGEELTQELPAPAHFEQAARMMREEGVAEAALTPSGTSPASKSLLVPAVNMSTCIKLGPIRKASPRFYEQEVLPKLR